MRAIGEAAERFQGRRILVTGANGYLGHNFIQTLKDVDCRIVALSRSAGTAIDTGKARVEFVVGDIRDKFIFERALKDIDSVFHFASQTSTYVANADPQTDFGVNVLPMLNMLDTCARKAWHPTIVFAGAATEVGVPDRIPVDETFADKPVTVYDQHKLFAENYLKYYARQGVVKGTTLRLCNVYGPGPKSSSKDRGILNLMMRRALNGETLTIYGQGEHIRDYVYVDDVVSAFLAAAESQSNCNGRHFVLGSGEGHSVADAIRTVAEVAASRTNRRAVIENVAPPASQSPIEYRNFLANTDAFRKAAGWSPATHFKDGIAKTVDHLLKETVKV